MPAKVTLSLPEWVQYDGRLCGECTWCCRCFENQIPAADWEAQHVVASGGLPPVLATKPAGCACPWLKVTGAPGCVLHNDKHLPQTCADYVCPHILIRLGHRDLVRLASGRPYPLDVHRPDVFAAVLSESWVEARGVMPLIPLALPVGETVRLIRATRAVPAVLPDRRGSVAYGFLATFRLLAHGVDGQASQRVWAERLARCA